MQQSKPSNPKPKPDPAALLSNHTWSFTAIGTSWWIGIYEPIGTDRFAAVKQQITERIELFDHTYSRFRADSLVTQISQTAGSYEFPADAKPLFTLYRQLYEVTDAAVTPLIGQTLADAGYDAKYSLQPKLLATPPAWDEVLEINDTVLTAKQPLLLDFGAAGKGYLVDILASLLRAKGISQFCIDASGDMYCQGLKGGLRIGLENPDDTTQIIGLIRLGAGALCGSAGNRRRWGPYHHIMNPKTLRSPEHIKALWVQAPTATIADALTTALYFAEPDDLRKMFTFEHLILYADNMLDRSTSFLAELYIPEIPHV